VEDNRTLLRASLVLCSVALSTPGVEDIRTVLRASLVLFPITLFTPGAEAWVDRRDCRFESLVLGLSILFYVGDGDESLL